MTQPTSILMMSPLLAGPPGAKPSPPTAIQAQADCSGGCPRRSASAYAPAFQISVMRAAVMPGVIASVKLESPACAFYGAQTFNEAGAIGPFYGKRSNGREISGGNKSQLKSDARIHETPLAQHVAQQIERGRKAVLGRAKAIAQGCAGSFLLPYFANQSIDIERYFNILGGFSNLEYSWPS